jgi:urease accessory protein
VTFSSAPERFREASLSARERGRLDLAFAQRGGRTVLDRRLFTYPYTVTRPYYRDTAPAGMASVILQTVSGSLNAGDRVRQRLAAGPSASAHVTAQGATVVNGALSRAECAERLDMVAEAGSLLEYMPDLRILFPHAVLNQSARIVLGPGATAVFADGIVAHDPSGEGRPFGAYRSETRVEDEVGRLLAMDCVRVPGTSAAFAGRSRFAAYGTLYVATRRAPEAMAGLVDGVARSIDAAKAYGAASALPNGCGLSARFAAADGRGLRQGLAAAWCAVRMHLFGAVPGLLGQAPWSGMN